MPADLPSAIVITLLRAGDTIFSLWYYLVGGILLAALVTAKAPRLRLPDRGVPYPLSLAWAGLVGVLSPVCTAGTVPLLVHLQSQGLSASLAFTFLIASSMSNPQFLILTLGAFGLEFAAIQVASVLLISALLGLLLSRLNGGGLQTPSLGPDGGQTSSCHGAQGGKSFLRQVIGLSEHIGLYFIGGVLLGAALEVFLPQREILNLFRGHGHFSVILAAALGVPLYTCGGGVVPLLRSLARIGMTKGTALAFLLAGPATRPGILGSLAPLMQKRVLFLYLVAIVLAASIMGAGFDLVSP